MALSFEFVLALVIVYGTSYSLKFLEKYDIPVLAIEILAGIIFGAFLGVISPTSPGYEFLVSLASFGLLLIMFEAGLELDPSLIQRNPRTVAVLGALTFVLPFLAGVGLALSLGLAVFASFLVGVTISTTSLGLVYPLLEDFGYLGTDAGQLILSVTVLNDILSVVALAYGISLDPATGHPVVGIAVVTGTVLVFLVVVPVYLADHIERLIPASVTTNPVKFSVFAVVLFALLMELLGIHAILGGFFAGLLIAEVTQNGHDVEASMQPVVNLAAPIFFFFVGMQFDVSHLDAAALWLVAGVVAIGIGSKVVGAVVGGRLVSLDWTTTRLLAAAMPGRLSISVAAAEVGLARGLLSTTLYDSFIILSTLSVFVASLVFRYVATRDSPRSAPDATSAH